MEKTFGLIGGDRRQAELSRLLAADGNTVHTYGLDAWKPVGAGSLDRAAGADVIVLPLPLCRGDGVLNCQEGPMPTLDLFRRLRPQQRVLAGQVKPQQRREAADCGLCLEDYFLREELTVANAAATQRAPCRWPWSGWMRRFWVWSAWCWALAASGSSCATASTAWAPG